MIIEQLQSACSDGRVTRGGVPLRSVAGGAWLVSRRSAWIGLIAFVFAISLSPATAFQDSAQPSPEEIDRPQQLERVLTIINDAQASAEVRRIGAEDLLRLGFPDAVTETVRLLQSGDTAVRVAICDAVAALDKATASALDRAIVDALIQLVSAADAQIARKAGAALFAFSNGEIPRKLGSVAADETKPLETRLAAVDALSQNLFRRSVVEQLVALLESPDAEVRARCLSALRSMSRTDFGNDIDKVRQWWKVKQAMTPEVWLEDRVDYYRQRVQNMEDTLRTVRAESDTIQQELSRRLIDEMDAVFRLTAESQREALIGQWLADSLGTVRLHAVGRIASSIADGHRPSEQSHAALRRLLADDQPELRRAALDVLAALTDPAEAEHVLARLPVETDPEVREAALRALGRLRNPSAIVPLIEELRRPDRLPACAAAAAGSLGALGGHGRVEPAQIEPAIPALLDAYAAAGTDQIRLRSALLSAMASIADARFLQAFQTAIAGTNADILVPAIQGCAALKDKSRMDSIVALVDHEDARVRRRAIEALAALGAGAEQMALLWSRVQPNVEPSAPVRESAWSAFLGISRSLAPQARLEWLDRMQAQPDRQTALLEDIVRDWSSRNVATVTPEMWQAQLRLADAYVASERWAEALPFLRDLLSTMPESEKDTLPQLVTDTVRSAIGLRQYGLLSAVLPDLVPRIDGADRKVLSKVLLDHLDALDAAGDAESAGQLRTVLGDLPADLFGAGFRASAGLAKAGSADEAP